eukprot:PhM_4_TR5931/c0_g1_i7/m.65308
MVCTIRSVSFFYQIKLSKGVEKIMGIRCAGKHGDFSDLSLNVLPMGLSYAPGIAQTIANILVREAKSKLRDEEVHINAWVDNFVIGTKTKQQCERAISVFQHICHMFSVELKEPEGPAQKLEMLGVIIEHKDGETIIRPNEDTRKMQIKTGTPRNIYITLGRAIWAHYAIQRSSLAKYKTIREIMGRIGEKTAGHIEEWDKEWNLTTEEHREIVLFVTRAREAKFVISEKRDVQQNFMWCDASTEFGQGWVFANKNVCWKQRVRGTEDIALLEAWAAAEAALFLQQRGGGTIFTDNTVVFWSFLKGHSSSRSVNAVLQVLASKHTERPKWNIIWVPSELQSADSLSRNKNTFDLFHGPWEKARSPRWNIFLFIRVFSYQ